jgi:transposase
MNEAQPSLFPSIEDKTSSTPQPETSSVRGAARLVCADRLQLFLRPTDLESTLATDHPARTLWRFVETLDLSMFHERIEARDGVAGRSAIDPKILVTLLLYATSEGIGSAREIARLCESHDAYRWICGGVSVNHHTLSDFRVGHGKALDELLTQVLAVMMKQNLVTLTRVAQDGTKVRASAGAASFRREPTLKALYETAKEQVERVKKDLENPSLSSREAKAKARAAKDYEARVQKALEEMPKVREVKKTEEEKVNARVSTTDPEARVMKMGDGGYRPAYNVQLATTTEEGVIVGVKVTNAGNDMNQMIPMLEQVEERTGERPEEHLVDGGYVNHEAITNEEKNGTKIYAPPKAKKRGEGPSYEPGKKDSPEVVKWRKRMSKEEGQKIYKERASTAEWVNAGIKEHQQIKLRVRGIPKVTCIALWHAVTFNLMRWTKLAAA